MAASLGRLTKRAEFQRVAAARRKSVMPGLVLQAAARSGDNAGVARVGYTASRRVGNAVARNRARRRLRAAVDRVMPAHASSDVDFVVIARVGTLDRPFPDLVRDLERALKRLDAWRVAANNAGGRVRPLERRG
ncbi:MAG: ribonuclease P protein component [Alphaproteobacteria bacterium]